MTRNIRVLLADDHDVVREGLESFLACQSDIEVVASVATGRSAIRLSYASCVRMWWSWTS
jgi:two-component system, NarL family, response regulator NreC